MKLNTLHIAPLLDTFASVFPGQREAFVRLGNRCKHGLSIELRPVKVKHSKEQQGAYWASLHEFGRHLGYSAHETEELLHPAICAAAFGVKEKKVIAVDGHKYAWPIPRETSSKDADGNVRDIETYSILIDTLIRFAGEYGHIVEIK